MLALQSPIDLSRCRGRLLLAVLEVWLLSEEWMHALSVPESLSFQSLVLSGSSKSAGFAKNSSNEG